MKLSIIIPNFNSENTILKTLDSIYSQNLKDFEVIVIDNASTDNSLDLISKYPLKIIKLKKNYGASKARNKGISNASGKYLVFIDSDAWFSKNSLKKLVQKLKKVDIVFPKIIFENKDIGIFLKSSWSVTIIAPSISGRIVSRLFWVSKPKITVEVKNGSYRYTLTPSFCNFSTIIFAGESWTSFTFAL